MQTHSENTILHFVTNQMDEEFLYQPSSYNPVAEVLPSLEPCQNKLTDPTQIYIIKERVTEMWKLGGGARKYNPSPNPVSLMRNDIKYIKGQTPDKQPMYVVSEKSDGVQYLLMLGMWPLHVCGGVPYAVMIDRNYTIYELQVIADSAYYEQGSLFIGELVIEHDPRMARHMFLVFDVVFLKGERGPPNFLKRYMMYMKCFASSDVDILDDTANWADIAQKQAEDGRIMCDVTRHAMTFRGKRAVTPQSIESLWRSMQLSKHQTDGLIFTPTAGYVGSGTQMDLFKWKPDHTIDFEAELTRGDGGNYRWILFYRDKGVRTDGSLHGVFLPKPCGKNKRREEPAMAECPVLCGSNEYRKTIEQHYHQHNVDSAALVVECRITLPDAVEWARDVPMIICHIIRVRHDKVYANDSRTIQNTIRTIMEGVTINELCI